jgi:hypothetical protein
VAVAARPVKGRKRRRAAGRHQASRRAASVPVRSAGGPASLPGRPPDPPGFPGRGTPPASTVVLGCGCPNGMGPAPRPGASRAGGPRARPRRWRPGVRGPPGRRWPPARPALRLDRDGTPLPRPGPPCGHRPRPTRVAFSYLGAIRVLPAGGGAMTRLTAGDGLDRRPRRLPWGARAGAVLRAGLRNLA